MENLKGKIAIVTGGGQGLGQAISQVLAQAGAVVVVADLNGRPAKEAAAQIQSNGGEAVGLEVDVGDELQAAEAVRQVVERHHTLDILVNNAAVDITLSLEELSVRDWDRILATNLRGPFLMSKLAFPVMRRQGGGQIVNLASTASKRAWANASPYHASKWGLLGFSHALHVEGRPFGIKVTAVVSGGMRTPFLLDRFPGIDTTTLQDPFTVAQTVRFVLSQPDETVIPEIMVIPMRETSWP